MDEIPGSAYVEIRNGGYYAAGTRIGLDAYLGDQDRLFEEIKRQHPISTEMLERLQRTRELHRKPI
jgi:hypothetical protein